MRGSELSAEHLLVAYAQGFFPMPDPRSPDLINWYRPDPRAIIPLDGFHVSRSLRRELKRADLNTRFNFAFLDVMRACSEREETWITDDFYRAYGELHAHGFAHSVEVYQAEELVGGVYGVALGGAFFAESMFHRKNNMSKFALFRLVEHLLSQKFTLLECQFLTTHLESLGACEIPDSDYMKKLAQALKIKTSFL